MSLLQVVNLSFSWKKDKVLRNIEFELNEGECLLICGANGAGKSTLLHILAGIYTPDEGEIISTGQSAESIQDSSPDSIRGALVMQNPDLQILGQSPWEDILITRSNPTAEEKEKALIVCKNLGLEPFLHQPVQELSYGQKRKLCIASALLNNPSLLLLDEPAAGLDYPSLSALRNILEENKKNKLTQCITSHDIEPFADLADKVLILEEGQNIFFGKVENALEFIMNHQESCVRLPSSYKAGGIFLPW